MGEPIPEDRYTQGRGMMVVFVVLAVLALVYLVGHGAAERARLADFDQGGKK